ncbi:MAG TPA: LPS assembly protein LptD [Lysobacter sp.]|nr:LPS assembly protein LptD [Lysobacter sp.]
MHKPLRLLPLSLCIALALPAHAAEEEENWGLCPIEDVVPVFPDAPAPTGDAQTRVQLPTDISGNVLDGQLEGEASDSAVIRGNVALTRGDQFLGTDRLTYNPETGTYVAEGSVRYQDSGMRLTAARAQGNQEQDSHRIEDVRYQLTRRRGNGGAARVELEGDQGTLVGSTYSTCAPSQRAWELRASRIDIDTAEGMGVARNATLRIGKVPVLYVPWFMFPVDDRRRTGLLYPRIGNSGRNGFDWRQPIYLNLAPNYDATLEPRLMSKRGVALGGEFRWLYPQGNGRVGGVWMPNDQLPDDEPERYDDNRDGVVSGDERPGNNRGNFHLDAFHRLDNRWYARADLNWVSDDHYIEDFSSSTLSNSGYFTTSGMGLFGRGRHWEASLSADHYQLADYTLSEANLPYHRLPRAVVRWAQPFATWFEAGVDAEAVRFDHEEFGGGSRFDARPWLGASFEGAAWFVRPRVAWRYTGYALDDDKADEVAEARARAFAIENGIPYTPALDAQFRERSPSRSLPITSLDAGVYFDRSFSYRGERFLQTLEPRVYYLRVPYENQDDLPVFDTNLMSFSWGQLFRDNRYTGADRQADAHQITTALTTRFISEDDGRERLALSLGQIQYLDDSRVRLNAGEPPIEQGKSAWVVDASFAPSDRWTINAAYQWNPKFRREDLASLRVRYLIGEGGIVNIGYRYRRDPGSRNDLLEQVDFSFLYPINQNWSVVGRYYYSLLDEKELETIAGVQWESCCLAVRLVGRRYLRNRTGELNNSIQVEFELKGLGSAGQNTERVLRRAILGYDRDDLYLVPPSALNRRSGDDDLSDSLP